MVVTETSKLTIIISSIGNVSEDKNHTFQCKSERICEHLFVKRIVKRDFLLLEEGEPVWMLSLKSIYVRKLFVSLEDLLKNSVDCISCMSRVMVINYLPALMS